MLRLRPLLYPALLTGLSLLAASILSGMAPAWQRAASSMAVLAGTWLVLRLVDLVFWHGWLTRGGRRPPPRLLTDLFAAMVMIVAAMSVAASLYGVPVTGLLTTSGVLVAVIGFALRDMLASLFSGIALNIEHPFAIGDWIGLEAGETGRVIEVSWLTTQMRTKDGVIIIVPNAELATRRFKNFGAGNREFRTEIEVTIDHAIPYARIERLLLAAVRSVREANSSKRSSDLRIAEFSERGIIWRLRFWIDDYDKLVDIRFKVQRAVLQHLHQAGISLPYRQIDSYQAPMPERHLDLARHKRQVIGRAELFADMETDDLEALCAATIERHFSADMIITEEGEKTRSLYVVLEGYLDVTVSDGASGRVLVNRLAAGAFFGEFSLLTGAPRSARVQARSDCVLLEITETALEPILQKCPGLADHLARVLTARQGLTEKAKTQQATAQAERIKEQQLLGRIKSLFGL